MEKELPCYKHNEYKKLSNSTDNYYNNLRFDLYKNGIGETGVPKAMTCKFRYL